MMNIGNDITGPINIGSDEEYTIKELAEKIIQMTNSNSKIVHRSLPINDPRKRRPGLNKAKKILRWEAKIPIEKGLKSTIKYFQGIL